MDIPVPDEKKAPSKKKVFAEVRAVIDVSTDKREDTERLVRHFLQRRGIVETAPAEFAKSGKHAVMQVAYRVHGGWASDFMRKLTYDAKDLGIELIDLSVNTTRTEIPGECPRQECKPCEFARRGETYYTPGREPLSTRVPGTEIVQDTPVGTKPEDERKRRRFFNF